MARDMECLVLAIKVISLTERPTNCTRGQFPKDCRSTTCAEIEGALALTTLKPLPVGKISSEDRE